PGRARRNRSRDGHLRRVEPGLGRCRAPGDLAETPAENVVRDALPRADRPGRRHTRRRELSRRCAGVERRDHLSAEDRARALRSQLWNPGRTARRFTVVGDRPCPRDPRRLGTRRADTWRTAVPERYAGRTPATAGAVSAAPGGRRAAAAACRPRRRSHDAARGAHAARRAQKGCGFVSTPLAIALPSLTPAPSFPRPVPTPNP